MINDDQLMSSLTVRAIMARMDNAGLHKTAGAVALGVDEVTLEKAVTSLGQKIAMHHLRQRRIQSGLASLEVLTEPGEYKQANFLTNMLKRTPKTVPGAAGEVASEAAHLFPAPGGQAFRGEGAHAAEAAARTPGAIELPSYIRDFKPQELPTNMPREAPAAAATGLKTKSRPTQAFDPQELAINRIVEGRKHMLSGGRGGQAAPASGGMFESTTSFPAFGGAAGDAPPLFNLEALRGAVKQGSLAGAAGVGAALGGATGLGYGLYNAEDGHVLEDALRSGATGALSGAGAGIGGGLMGYAGGTALGYGAGQLGRMGVRAAKNVDLELLPQSLAEIGGVTGSSVGTLGLPILAGRNQALAITDRHKEPGEKQANAYLDAARAYAPIPATGAALGGLAGAGVGAYNAEEGERMRAALSGGALGAAGGALASGVLAPVGGALGLTAGEGLRLQMERMGMKPSHVGPSTEAVVGMLGGGMLGATAPALATGVAAGKAMAGRGEKQANAPFDAARRALHTVETSMGGNGLKQMGMGAGIGAIGGGLVDEDHQRGALLGGLAGGSLGALGSAASNAGLRHQLGDQVKALESRALPNAEISDNIAKSVKNWQDRADIVGGLSGAGGIGAAVAAPELMRDKQAGAGDILNAISSAASKHPGTTGMLMGSALGAALADDGDRRDGALRGAFWGGVGGHFTHPAVGAFLGAAAGRQGPPAARAQKTAAFQAALSGMSFAA